MNDTTTAKRVCRQCGGEFRNQVPNGKGNGLHRKCAEAIAREAARIQFDLDDDPAFRDVGEY